MDRAMKRGHMTFDGGSRGNPGPAAGAAVIRASNEKTKIVSRYLGESTNNVAEYKALILGLDGAHKLGIEYLTVQGDSKLIVCHVTGEWECRSELLKPLLEIAQEKIALFPKWELEHFHRSHNKEADHFVNLCLDQNETVREYRVEESS